MLSTRSRSSPSGLVVGLTNEVRPNEPRWKLRYPANVLPAELRFTAFFADPLPDGQGVTLNSSSAIPGYYGWHSSGWSAKSEFRSGGRSMADSNRRPLACQARAAAVSRVQPAQAEIARG